MLLFEYLLLAGQFAGPFYLLLKKKKKREQQPSLSFFRNTTYVLSRENYEEVTTWYFWRASKKKLHVKATMNDSYQRYQNFDALVNKLLNSAYLHVNEKTKNKFQFNFENIWIQETGMVVIVDSRCGITFLSIS